MKRERKPFGWINEANEIKKFTDKELVLELRKRGFDVKAEKVVKTIL